MRPASTSPDQEHGDRGQKDCEGDHESAFFAGRSSDRSSLLSFSGFCGAGTPYCYASIFGR
jgi:hypothetical protein